MIKEKMKMKMKRNIEVRNLIIGEGIPKICVPIVGESTEQLIDEIKSSKNLEVDLVEWRMDYYKEIQNLNQITQAVDQIREALGDMPLLATFRSKKEGGQRELNIADYIELNKNVIATGKIDLIDVELFTGDNEVKEIVDFAHQHNVKVVMSNHDFNKTPCEEEIVKRLCKMQALNADLPKIAVMPRTPQDVLILLSATNEMNEHYADRPIITMSMAKMGIISRLAGEIFGSALTFGTAKVASAPGQIEADELKKVLNIIHSL